MSLVVYMQNLVDELEFQLDRSQETIEELNEESDAWWAFMFDWVLPYCNGEITKELFVQRVVNVLRAKKLEREANGLEKKLVKEKELDIACGPYGEDLQD